MRVRRGTWRWVALLGTLSLFLATGTPVWAAEPVTLELQAPEQLALGDKVSVTAMLKDANGSPVPAGTVILWTSGSFLSVGGAVQLGEAATDAQGRVTFTYEARNEGAVTLNAYFRGDSRYGFAQGSAAVDVQGSAQLTRHPIEGVRVPGIGVWILAAILGGVWSTYLAVMVFLTLIAREGRVPAHEALHGAGGRRG
ncbi:MAG: Ig-like domain-containing protein [Chloroflexi bacterium]|nr:Ig-like domain-containing protein [Chloroflexota bacterium]